MNKLLQQLKKAFTDWDEIEIKYQKAHPDAIGPEKAHRSDSCFDLFSVETTEVKPNTNKIISTGIIVEFPEGYAGQIRPRSSVEQKNSIYIHCGTIDNSYRGELMILVKNYGTKTFRVKKGERLAQLFIEKIPEVKFIETNDIDLTTSRGNNGFGSSGK